MISPYGSKDSKILVMGTFTIIIKSLDVITVADILVVKIRDLWITSYLQDIQRAQVNSHT